MAMTGVSGSRVGGRGPASWWRFGAGAGAMGVPGALGWVCPAAAIVLAVVEVAVPLLAVVVAGGVAVFGNEQASERVFRLLRLVTGREEPPGPPEIARSVPDTRG
jgi:hypothetical protein